MNYSELKDEELIKLIDTDENAFDEILLRYKLAVRKIARQYFIVGGEDEDLVQEGTFGLFKAVKNYNGKFPFKNFAFACIKNSIITAVKKDNSQKHRPLNFYVSLSTEDSDSSDKNFIVRDTAADPEEEFINSEREQELKREIENVLSDFEYRILTLYLEGYSYAEIAKKENKTLKSVDNAVQRIRKKIQNIQRL